MKKMKIIFVLMLLLGTLFSCSNDEAKLNDLDQEKATLSFGSLLNDMAGNKTAIKEHLDDIPGCSDAVPDYVEVALSLGGAWAAGSDTNPVRVELNPNPSDFDGDGAENYFTEESSELELIPGDYSLEYFKVFDADGNMLWIAPRNGDLVNFVNNGLPLNISLGAGVKKYVSVDVLCFDDRLVNEYGYLFFDINENRLSEFCIFGNFCDENGRHFPAHFSVDVWQYSGDSNNPKGNPIELDLMNNVGVNDDGDAFADPLCVVLPDSEGNDEYYFEITLMESDAYETEERIIRSGVITDEEVRAFNVGENNQEYYHFREGNCGTGDTPALFTEVSLKVIADNMTSPVGMAAAPDDSGWLFVIDQIGKVWIIDENGEKLDEPFLDVSSKLVNLNPEYDERGLLGMAFHPDYAINGRFFVYYSAPPVPGGPTPSTQWDNLARISEFTVSGANSTQANMGSERVILDINEPQSNHAGGTIAFGPDNYLYISLGDGGAANDVAPGHVEDWYEENAGGNGQDIEANLLGNILRIDVDGAMPYSIPSDNPFVGKEGLDEIYAYGFRNPYRFSFDMEGSRRLFVGDVGQVLWEEISIVEKGGNYGWNVKEGTHCFNAANNEEVLANCPEVDVYGNELIDPVIEMKNHHNPAGGRTLAIVGGYVYHGDDIPAYKDQYIFGSFSRHHDEPSGEIFMAIPSVHGLWSFDEIEIGDEEDIGYFLKGFGQDLNGEIYLAVSEVQGPNGNTGKILKLANN